MRLLLDGPLSLGRRALLTWLTMNRISLTPTKRPKREIKALEGLSRLIESMLRMEAGTGMHQNSAGVLRQVPFGMSNMICVRGPHLPRAFIDIHLETDSTEASLRMPGCATIRFASFN